MLVVSDNSPVRYLRVLDCVHVLPILFGRIFIPHAVLGELQHPHTPVVVRTWFADPPAWLAVHPIVGRPSVSAGSVHTPRLMKLYCTSRWWNAVASRSTRLTVPPAD